MLENGNFQRPKSGTLNDIREYRDKTAFSYTFLKNILENNVKPFKGSIASMMGSAIDCMLFCPDDFDTLFFIDDVKRPSGDLVDIIEDLFNRNIEWSEIELVKLAKIKNFGNNKFSDEVIIEKFKKLKYWYDTLFNRGDKELITEQEYKSAKYWKDFLLRENHTREIINKGVYQVPHFTELEFKVNQVNYKVPVKCLPDILVFNTIGGILKNIEMYDLKCTEYSYEHWCSKKIKDNYYLIQQSLYHDILTQIYEVPVKCNWMIVSYKSKKSVIKPTDEKDIYIGREGARTINNVTYTPSFEMKQEDYIDGYKDAIIRYYQSQELGIKDYDIKFAISGGILDKKSIFE